MFSWKNIYDPAFAREIISMGKKFYPKSGEGKNLSPGQLTCLEEDGDPDENNSWKQVAILRRGFFSSVRPGNGSLYLNVNVATSAVYPPENLYAYMNKRWETSAGMLASELKSVRVRFDGDGKKKARAIQKILGSNECSGQKTFANPKNGRPISIRRHIEDSKYRPFILFQISSDYCASTWLYSPCRCCVCRCGLHDKWG
jgi:hypothetical protein